MEKILVINLGGTSSKVAIYFDENLYEKKTISHEKEELADLFTNKEQIDYRTKMINNWLREIDFDAKELTAIGVRGGNLPSELSKSGGTYFIDSYLQSLILANYDDDGQFYHGVVIGVPIALNLRNGNEKIGIYVTDPPTVNELEPVAKIAGHPDFERIPVFHALNQRAVARRVAKEMNKTYEETRLIVVHLGAGISVGVHCGGRVIDVNNVTRGDGPMAPNRAGQLPMSQLIEAVYKGNCTLEEAQLKLRLGGGVKAYLGTDDMRKVEEMILSGDEYAKLIWEALVYQVAKEIGSCFTVLDGKVDAICYTGGMAFSDKLITALNKKVDKLAPIKCYPGEFENEGLALGALRVIRGDEQAVQIEKE